MTVAVLTDKDHNELGKYLRQVLDAHKTGKIDREKAVDELAHVITAVDRQRISEVRASFTVFADSLDTGDSW